MGTQRTLAGLLTAMDIDGENAGIATQTVEHMMIHKGQFFTLPVSLTVANTKVGAIWLAPPAGVAASLTVTGGTGAGDVTYTALATGADGNNISIEHVDPGAASQELSVVVTGTDIVVNLATGSNSAISSTAADVKAAVNADTYAARLVSAEDEGSGTGLVTEAAHAHLEGGVTEVEMHLKVPTIGSSVGPMTVVIEEDVTFTGTTATPTPVNRNRKSSRASTVVCKTCADATLVDGDNDLDIDGIIIPGATQGSMKVGSVGSLGEEFVLDPGKNYVIHITNGSGNSATVNASVSWYEVYE